MMKRLIFIALILLTGKMTYGQDNKTVAREKAKKAIELMDKVSVDEAILLLDEAKKLDPGTYIYDYEIGYAYTIKQDYKKALEIYKKVIRYKDANDQCYQMLGNVYDYNGEPRKAIEAYDKGLKKFPNSGILYLEKGTIYAIQKNYDEAISLYESGIKADPAFPSNYYRATQLLCRSEQEVWGMLYGEIFLNLEPNTVRTEEISKLLFDTYKSQIKFTSDTSLTVSFCKNAVINISIDDLKHFEQIKLPFGTMIYEPTLILSIVNEKNIDLNSLNRIRGNFVFNYFEQKHNIKYPNVLFDYQKTLKDSGYLEPYNYWLLSSGDINNFSVWKEKNEDKWNKFVDWINNNKLTLNQDKKFSRDQY
jgi:tetratricopeptide (TPR) repeat protein